MHRLFSIILLSAYLINTGYTLLPFAEYYIRYDVIVNEYCVQKDLEDNLCMGKCYLNNKVLEAVKNQMDVKTNDDLHFEYPVLSPHILNYTISIIPATQFNEYPSTYININTSHIKEIPAPPPKHTV